MNDVDTVTDMLYLSVRSQPNQIAQPQLRGFSLVNYGSGSFVPIGAQSYTRTIDFVSKKHKRARGVHSFR